MLDENSSLQYRAAVPIGAADQVTAFRLGEELAALEAAALPARTIKANTDLSADGAAMNQLYIIKQGWMCRYKTSQDGNRQIIALLVPGDIANLDALMVERPGYGLSTITDAKVVAIPRHQALELIDQIPGMMKALLRLALLENAVLARWVFCLGHHSALQRLAHLLCELEARLAVEKTDRRSILLPLTQAQIGDVLGMSTVHVNRVLQQLRSQGLVSVVNHWITLLDLADLRKIAEFDEDYLH